MSYSFSNNASFISELNISLARENTAPISRQTYEVLSGFWSTYRDYQTEDFFISIDDNEMKIPPPKPSE